MDTRQRRAFVKFVTASVCMPVEGNPIVVHPQVVHTHEHAPLNDFACTLSFSLSLALSLFLSLSLSLSSLSLSNCQEGR